MKKIQRDERLLRGQWLTGPGGIRPDETAARVEWLIENALQKVADSPDWGAWLTLYRDPGDGRYWERSFPQGELQGGGPPQLEVISAEDAATRYRISHPA